MRKLTPEEALAKVEAFEKASGATVAAPVKAADVEPKGIGSDSFVMPAAKAVEVTEVVEVAEVVMAPQAAAKSKKKEEK